MIEEGQTRNTRYWGQYKVLKIVEIDRPEIATSKETGRASFKYTLTKIKWPTGKPNFWFPYWVTIKGKEKYGQFAPMMSESSLLNLLQKAIDRDFFSRTFLRKLDRVISDKLNAS